MAHHKKILISVSDSLLEEVDLLAQRQNVNRSEFIREAMRLYIKDRKKQQRAEMMKKGYEDMAKNQLGICKCLL